MRLGESIQRSDEMIQRRGEASRVESIQGSDEASRREHRDMKNGLPFMSSRRFCHASI